MRALAPAPRASALLRPRACACAIARVRQQRQRAPSSPLVVAASAASFPSPSNDNPATNQAATTTSSTRVGAYVELARVHNIAPAALLAFVGASAAARSIPAALLSPPVWVAAAASAGISVASAAINDFWDVSGDKQNRPYKPLPSGRVPSDGAVLFAAVFYIAVLATACLLESRALRAVIAFSATATMAYTPFLKRVPLVKNLTVASVIALAPVAGALAVSGGGAAAAGVAAAASAEEAVRRLLPCAAFAFWGVVYREIIMDCHDLEGDLADGVTTVPALVGRGGALAVALASLGVGMASALALLYGGRLLGGTEGLLLFELPSATAAALGIFTAPVLAAVAAAPALLLVALSAKCALLALSAARSGWEPARVDDAVMACLKPMGLGIMMLAAVAAFGA